MQLTREIKKMREQPDKQGSEVGKPNILNTLEARNSQTDLRSVGARSGGSRRSVTQEAGKDVMKNSRTSNFVKPKSPQGFVDGLVVHEDPAEKLCINEVQWNNIVEENKRKFEADKVKNKEMKLNKAKII